MYRMNHKFNHKDRDSPPLVIYVSENDVTVSSADTGFFFLKKDTFLDTDHLH